MNTKYRLQFAIDIDRMWAEYGASLPPWRRFLFRIRRRFWALRLGRCQSPFHVHSSRLIRLYWIGAWVDHRPVCVDCLEEDEQDDEDPGLPFDHTARGSI